MGIISHSRSFHYTNPRSLAARHNAIRFFCLFGAVKKRARISHLKLVVYVWCARPHFSGQESAIAHVAFRRRERATPFFRQPLYTTRLFQEHIDDDDGAPTIASETYDYVQKSRSCNNLGRVAINTHARAPNIISKLCALSLYK